MENTCGSPPLYADLRDFRPKLIEEGLAETLLDDATRFAAVLGAADVAVTLEVRPHMIHAWHLVECASGARPPRPGEGAGAFIRRHL